MDINVIIDLVNNGCSLSKIAEKIGSSKSTVARFLKKNGYVYNNELGRYLKNGENVSRETIDIVKREKNKNVNRTYSIPMELDKALKFKAINLNITVSELLREILYNNIEEKYFKGL